MDNILIILHPSVALNLTLATRLLKAEGFTGTDGILSAYLYVDAATQEVTGGIKHETCSTNIFSFPETEKELTIRLREIKKNQELTQAVNQIKKEINE